MSYNLIYLKFNNYYNRKEIIYDTIADYISQATYYETQTTKNFEERDGVDTKTKTAWSNSWKPDYLLVVTETNTIVSRWFVTHFDFIRGNLYDAVLRRDLIAEVYNQVIEAPAYIEKATVTNLFDPAVYNKEDLLLNQIKKAEQTITDNSGIAWLVGFFDSSMTAAEFQDLFKDGTKYKYINYGKSPDYTTADITTWNTDIYNRTYTYINDSNQDNLSIVSAIKVLPSTGTGITTYRNSKCNYNLTSKWLEYNNSLVLESINGSTIAQVTADADAKSFVNSLSNTSMLSYLTAYAPSNYNQNVTDLVDTYSGKVVYDTTAQKYYEIRVSTSLGITGQTSAAIISALGLKIQQLLEPYNATIINSGILIQYQLTQVTFTFVEVARASGKIWTDASTIVPNESIMNDAPYCGFCIPYGDIRVTATGRHDVSVFKDQSLGAVNLLSYCLQNGKYLYDVQLLPFCPMLNANELYMSNSTTIRYDNVSSARVLTFYSTDGTTFTADNDHALSKAFLFFNSSFTFDYEYSIPDKTTALEKKIANCSEMYRIVSPNYSSYFEFSPYENNGVTKFNVDCTYKPYKSYIHVNPDFAGLFGRDYNDSRGLVITSDFSIPQVNDAWQSYQISNKNYSQIFERQVQNMRFNNRWNAAESIFGAITGGVSGGVSGGLTGAVAGGPAGLVAGAALGGVASAVGGITDIAKTFSTQREALDYTKDLYNYNLQNIQALPNSLASVSSFDANNKLFPFIEKYDCTDVEKEALRNKLTWNGWKIGRIGTISQFIQSSLTYIKCKLIRLEDTDLETNQILALAEELDKGVFI